MNICPQEKYILSSTHLFPVRVLKGLFFSRSIRGGNIVLHGFLNCSPFRKLLNFFQRVCKLWEFFIFHDFVSVLFTFFISHWESFEINLKDIFQRQFQSTKMLPAPSQQVLICHQPGKYYHLLWILNYFAVRKLWCLNARTWKSKFDKSFIWIFDLLQPFFWFSTTKKLVCCKIQPLNLSKVF